MKQGLKSLSLNLSVLHLRKQSLEFGIGLLIAKNRLRPILTML